MIDVSDEATGLPPLHEVHPEDAILALSWTLGNEGLVTVPTVDEPMAVRYVSFRGLILDEDGKSQYGQIHVAVPTQAVGPLLEQWAQTLQDDTPDMG